MSVLIVVLIMLVGAVAVTTASVAVNDTYRVGPYYFAVRHYLFLALATVVMLGMTMLKPKQIALMGLVLFGLAFAGLLLTFVIGEEVKGARRWMRERW